MARPEMPGSESERAMEAEIARASDAAAVELAAAQAGETETPRRYASRSSSAERDRLVQDARNIDFPVALRGYERAAVDRYVKDVNRLITELEMSSSPESAVRRALEEVSEETRELLQRAHQTAEDITARSRRKADDRVRQAELEAEQLSETAQRDADEVGARAQQEAQEARELAQRETGELRSTAQREADDLRSGARREADELLQAAEDRVRELTQSAETIWRERRRLIEDVRAVGEQLVSIGESEAKRFPRSEDEAGSGPAPRTEG